MLLNDFFTYKVAEKSDDKIIADVEFNKEHNIYKGHFPDMPITPGVCQIQMVQEILNDVTSGNYSLKSARDIKFLNFIDPSKTNRLQLELSMSSKIGNEMSVNAVLRNEGVNYLKMRSVFIQNNS